MAARKVMNLKQIADAYGVDYRTLKRDMALREGLYDDLDAADFDDSKFYPIHQKIIEEYFGKMPEMKKHE